MNHQQKTLEDNFSSAEIATFEKILKFYANGGEA